MIVGNRKPLQVEPYSQTRPNPPTLSRLGQVDKFCDETNLTDKNLPTPKNRGCNKSVVAHANDHAKPTIALSCRFNVA